MKKSDCIGCVPEYGGRNDWIPRCDNDYIDGGAFPEIHLAQYPLGLGLKSMKRGDEVQPKDTGKIAYNCFGLALNEKKSVFNMGIPSDRAIFDFKKPNIETKEEIAIKTKQALEKLTSQKINAAMPNHFGTISQTQYLRYTPIHQGDEFNSGAKQRVIKMVESQVDPMEPPKFKINKKIPRGPPSPPAPILHSPSRKVSTKEQKEWKVPPCISNWKNAKGYTIPLDKRLAADGRGLQQLHINEKFAKMAEALYIADRKAREAVEARAQLEKKLAQKEKEKKEDMLRAMAQKAREERAGLRFSEDISVSDIRDRNEIRTERHKERIRDKNIARAAPDKRLKLQKDRDRDITEQIALGKCAKINSDFEMQFDQRLFDTSKGINSGYENDDFYNIYDKPWRDTSASLQTNRNNGEENDIYGAEEITKHGRYIPDKKFSGSEQTERSSKGGPVQFEKEDDPFGLDQFLNMAKKAIKRVDDDGEKKREFKRYKT